MPNIDYTNWKDLERWENRGTGGEEFCLRPRGWSLAELGLYCLPYIPCLPGALPYSILPPALFFTSLFQLQLYVDTWVRTEFISGLALCLQANVGPKTFAVCLIAACYANLSSGIIPWVTFSRTKEKFSLSTLLKFSASIPLFHFEKKRKKTLEPQHDTIWKFIFAQFYTLL